METVKCQQCGHEMPVDEVVYWGDEWRCRDVNLY